jgi:uncharacterized protein (TIGR03437 family)
MQPSKQLKIVVISTSVLALALKGQPAPPSILSIDMENVVQYHENFADPSKNGSLDTQGAPVPAVRFSPGYIIADIVAVNGQKARGTTVTRYTVLGMSSSPSPAQSIADVNRSALMEIAMEILQEDGSAVGAIVLNGFTAGPAPAGVPRSAPAGNFAVTGGTGAFYGVRGQAATARIAPRATSTQENPFHRRTFGGGQWRIVLQLIPQKTPEILTAGSGPAFVHASDFAPVTAQRPAQPGEMLALFASGLGPTRPGVDPGQPFPASPAQVAASPVEVLVNGKPGEVVYAGGYPNTVDGYQVNFRVPADTAPGIAALQLRVAWISGGEARIPVR